MYTAYCGSSIDRGNCFDLVFFYRTTPMWIFFFNIYDNPRVSGGEYVLLREGMLNSPHLWKTSLTAFCASRVVLLFKIQTLWFFFFFPHRCGVGGARRARLRPAVGCGQRVAGRTLRGDVTCVLLFVGIFLMVLVFLIFWLVQCAPLWTDTVFYHHSYARGLRYWCL